MENTLSTIRQYDLRAFLKLYQFGLNNQFIGSTYLFFSRYGIVIFFLSFIYLIWVKRINALLCSMLSMLLAGTVDLIIYIIWKRPRPFVAHADLISQVSDQTKVDLSSFPSSHTYIAFAVATSIFLYGHKKLGSFLFFIAILVAISRVGAGLHYPSDVIGGAMLGIFSGIVAYLFIQKVEKYWE
jgi:undecaprenyl-diphosphatase